MLNSDCLEHLLKVKKNKKTPFCHPVPSLKFWFFELVFSFSLLGLAQTAVHGPTSSPVIPSSWFDESEASLVSRFTSALGFADNNKSRSEPDIHAFTILARVIADPALAPLQYSENEFYQEIAKTHGDHIVKYVNEWNLDGDLDKKVEELLWTNVLIYAVGGSEEEGSFNADFFQYARLVSPI